MKVCAHQKIGALLIACVALLLGSGVAHAHKAKQDSFVTIIEPHAGAKLTNPVKFVFQANKVEINAVGVRKHKSGHVILLINADIPGEGDAVKKDAQHIHFVNGEREAELELPRGKNRLQILLGDEEHEMFQEWLYSDPIVVYVE
jgi:hypothetical protein